MLFFFHIFPGLLMIYLRKYPFVFIFIILCGLSITSILSYNRFIANHHYGIWSAEQLKREFLYLLIDGNYKVKAGVVDEYKPLFRVLDFSGNSRIRVVGILSRRLIIDQAELIKSFNRNKQFFHLVLILQITMCIISLFLLVLNLSRFHLSKKNEDYKDKIHRKMLDILEKDRHLISCELHDDLAQKLAMINQFFNHPDINGESIELLKKYSRESIQQVRLVSHRLKTPGISSSNFREAYEEFFSDYKLLTGINLNFKLIGVSALKLDEETNVHIFRIVQELLNNAFKHSRAKEVFLSLLYTHPHIIVKYRDNGVGYSFEESQNRGLGLSSIQFRMNMLGADWIHRDTMSPGVNLVFKVPVNE